MAGTHYKYIITIISKGAFIEVFDDGYFSILIMPITANHWCLGGDYVTNYDDISHSLPPRGRGSSADPRATW